MRFGDGSFKSGDSTLADFFGARSKHKLAKSGGSVDFFVDVVNVVVCATAGVLVVVVVAVTVSFTGVLSVLVGVDGCW